MFNYPPFLSFPKVILKIVLFGFFVLVTFHKGICQKRESYPKVNNKIGNAIELRHDNDLFYATDRYYSAGLFIGWRKLSILETDSIHRTQYRLFLSQEMYTPTDIIATDIDKFDRPYAGFLGVSGGVTETYKKSLFDYKLLVGFSGPLSGASFVQNLFHKSATVDSRIPSWVGQIKTSFYINLYFNYVQEWKFQANPFSVYMAISPKAAFGNRDNYLQNDMVFYFGKRNSMMHSAVYQQIGDFEKELFFAIRLGYRYVINNAMLGGNALGDSSIYLLEPYQHLFLYNLEIHRRGKRNIYKFSCNFSTPETFNLQPQLYTTFTFLRSF
jgi:hypothetical protein